MPVSYRQSMLTAPIRTTITMRGDRYLGVNEAVSGWEEAGVPLVGHFNGKWEPVPCGDDTGLFYIVPLLARTMGWNADESINRLMFAVLMAAATIGLAGLLIDAAKTRQRWLAFIPILAGTILSYKVGDVYLIQGAVIMVTTPWLIHSLGDVPEKRRLLIAVTAGIVAGFAQWIRAGSGLPVLVLFAGLACFSGLRARKKFALSVALLLGMSLPLLYARLPLYRRDEFLIANDPTYRTSLNRHLFWHTVYVGLGYLANPYVSGWRDAVAVEYVEGIDPTAVYGGERYEEIIKARVGAIAKGHPRFVLYTIVAKAGVMLCVLLACLNFGLVAAILRPKPLSTELAFWLAMATAALPSIIAIPDRQYAVGMIALGLFYWYYSICFYLANPPAASEGSQARGEKSRDRRKPAVQNRAPSL